MKTILYIALIFAMLLLSPLAFSFDEKRSIDADQIRAQCFSKEWGEPELIKLKEGKFIVNDKVKRETLALQLLHCLAHPNTKIRDGVAFATLSFWLREGQLSQVIHLKMYDYLTKVISSEVSDSIGVYQSFSMLVLSEVARVDRQVPFLTDAQRGRLVSVGTEFLTNVRDYRGFSTKVGWRHSVAHSSDLMLQLALNPAITKPQLDTMLDALASQITAHEQHYYTNGEPKRMAMAVVYILLRGEHSAEDWNVWLKNVTDSSPFKEWQKVYQNEKGLMKLHNTQSFLYSLYGTIKPSKNAILTLMIPSLEIAIKEVN
jgi:hypothetical protein